MVMENEADLLVAESGQLFLFQLKWILPVEANGTACWRFECAYEIEQRALAASGRAHDGHRVAASKRERNVGDDFEWSVGRRILFADVLDLQHKTLRKSGHGYTT